MAFPETVLSTKVELWYDEQWNNITTDVRGTGAEDGEIVIGSRGQPDETTNLTTTTAEFAVNNANGKYSPRNFLSPLYGKLGMNNPVRIITDISDTKNVVDDFSTDGTNGWPNADSGHVYTASGGSIADYFTSGGLAYHRHTAVDTGHECYLNGLEVTDFDAVLEGIALEAPPTVGQAVLYWRGRISNGGADFVQAVITYLPSGSVLCRLEYGVLGGGAFTTNVFAVPSTSDVISARFRAVGRDLYLRAWETGTEEPSTWDITFTVPVITPGAMMVGTTLRPDLTNAMPYDITFQGLHFDLGIILFTGEISEFPKKWDKTGNDVWVTIQASGLTRRLSQGDKPIHSPLYRHYRRLEGLLAYWSFENMTGTSTAYPSIASDLDDAPSMHSQNPNPAQDAEIKWSDESTLLGSDPLPSVLVGASTFGFMEYGGANMLPASTSNNAFSIGVWYNVQLREDVADSVQNVNIVVDMQNGNPGASYQLLIQHTSTAGVQASDISAYAYNADLTAVVASIVNFPFTYTPGWHYYVMSVEPSGGNMIIRVWQDGVQLTSTTVAVTSIGQPQRLVWINVGAYTSTISSSVGHFAIASGVTTDALHANMSETVDIGLVAYAGETDVERLQRIFAEEGITLEVTATDDEDSYLGPQKTMTFMQIVHQTAQAGDGVVYEMREDFGYRYKTRRALYGGESALTLDYSNTDLSEVPETTDDDQRLRNQITIKREGGAGSVTVSQVDGPVSIEDPRAANPGAGLYNDEPPGINLFSDDQRLDYAGWRLRLGTWDESRFPGVSVALHRAPFVGDRAKFAAAALLDIAEILTITNPPVWLPPDNIVLQMRSVKVFLSNFNWGIEWNTLPGRPWTDVASAGPDYGRADTVDSVLVSSVDSDDIDLIVFTNETDLPWSDPLWTEDAAELNILGAEGIDFRLNPQTLKTGRGGERVRATVNESIRDTFTRSGQLGGSNADTGQTWVSSFGTAADATTDGTKAVLAHPSANTALVQTLPGTNPDMCLEVDVSFNFTTATGASIFVSVVMRQVDLSNYYNVILEKQAGDANPVLYVQKVVAGVATNLLARRITNQSTFRFKIELRNRDILVKQWDPSTAVEGDWDYTLRGAASDNLTGTDIAFRTSRSTGNTNTNPTINFDNLKVLTGRIRPVTYDRFARTVVNGLGSADTGETWTNRSGGGVISASDWQVTPNQASTTIPAANAYRGGDLLGVSFQDVCVSLMWTAPLATGATMSQFVGIRSTPGSFVYGYVDINTNNTLTMVIGSTLNGLLAFATVPGVTHSATQAMRSKVCAIGNQLMMKVWRATDNEPAYWMLRGTLADATISGAVLFQNSRAPGNTNVNPQITVADFKIENPQRITVQRGMDGASRAWDAGTDVRLWNPAQVGR